MAKQIIKLMKPFHRHEHFVFVDFLKVYGHLGWQDWVFIGFFFFFWTSIKVRSIHVCLYSTFSQSMLFESRKPCLNVLKPPVTVANVIKKKSIRCLGNGRENLERNQAQLGESVLL